MHYFDAAVVQNNVGQPHRKEYFPPRFFKTGSVQIHVIHKMLEVHTYPRCLRFSPYPQPVRRKRYLYLYLYQCVNFPIQYCTPHPLHPFLAGLAEQYLDFPQHARFDQSQAVSSHQFI